MKLNEVVIPANDQMTVEQQTALLAIYISRATSPAAAAEALKGDSHKMAAGEYLIMKRYIIPMATGVEISERGIMELISMGLIQQGKVTEKGKQLINVNQPEQKKDPVQQPEAQTPVQQPQGVMA